MDKPMSDVQIFIRYALKHFTEIWPQVDQVSLTKNVDNYRNHTLHY